MIRIEHTGTPAELAAAVRSFVGTLDASDVTTNDAKRMLAGVTDLLATLGARTYRLEVSWTSAPDERLMASLNGVEVRVWTVKTATGG